MHLLDAAFAWVVTTSLRASLLAVAILAFRRVMGKRLTARCRYALWLPMILVIVMPILPTSPWSVEGQVAWLSATLSPSASRPFGAIGSSGPAVLSWMLTGCPLLAAGWLFVALALLVIAGIGYRRNMARIVRSAKPVRAELFDDLVAEARRVQLRRLPRVIVSAAVDSPAVTGLLQPVLLLPASFPDGLTRTESGLILLHELTHLKRRDLAFNWCLCMLQALHWFNPLLWLAFGRLRADRECACDARVLSVHQKDLRAEYADALLKMHQPVSSSGLSLAFGGSQAAGALRDRLLIVTRHRQVHPGWSVAGVTAVAGLLLAGATHAPSSEGIAQSVARRGGMGKGEVTSLLVRASVGLLPLVEQIEKSAPSVGQVRRFYEAGDFSKNSRDERFHKRTDPNFDQALPEWWPGGDSARILFHPDPLTKQRAPWRPHVEPA